MISSIQSSFGIILLNKLHFYNQSHFLAYHKANCLGQHPILHVSKSVTSLVIRQKGESQNRCFKANGSLPHYRRHTLIIEIFYHMLPDIKIYFKATSRYNIFGLRHFMKQSLVRKFKSRYSLISHPRRQPGCHTWY